MSLAQRMEQRLIELQRARQGAIDAALLAGSRPGFDPRGRVILVKGDSMETPSGEYHHGDPDVFELDIAGIKHRVSVITAAALEDLEQIVRDRGPKPAAGSWFRALRGEPIAAIEETPSLDELFSRPGKATRDLEYYTKGDN